MRSGLHQVAGEERVRKGGLGGLQAVYRSSTLDPQTYKPEGIQKDTTQEMILPSIVTAMVVPKNGLNDAGTILWVPYHWSSS